MSELSLTGKKWSVSPQLEAFEDFKKIRGFFPETESIDPFEMHDMDIACTRIYQAIEHKERIMVFGDFDADGITATVILVHALQRLGAKVSYRIPDRVKDSHGLKNHLIDEIAENKVDLIVTCDCGINDNISVKHAVSLGIDVIITDHHTPDKNRFPSDAVAVVNPKLSPDFPDQDLSGSAVALKLIEALIREKKSADFLFPYYEMAAIGTVADCVSLTGENRRIVKTGLSYMKNSAWSGLQFLLESNRVAPENINAQTIGFTIAPRINAASRIGDCFVAVQLFLGKESDHARRVEYLENLNNERKVLTTEGVEMAAVQIQGDKNCQVLFHEHWEPGILGLIASRYCEQLGQPIIASTLNNGKLSASCRAPQGVCMVSGLKKSADFFLGFGGHAGAAGFVAKPDQLDSIRESLQTHFSKYEMPTPEVEIDAWIDVNLLDKKSADFLETLAPFGEGNPKPIFGMKDFGVSSIETLGSSGQHFKIYGKHCDKSIEILAFFAEGYIDNIRSEDTVDILIEFSQKYWRGQSQFEYKLVDIKK